MEVEIRFPVGLSRHPQWGSSLLTLVGGLLPANGGKGLPWHLHPWQGCWDHGWSRTPTGPLPLGVGAGPQAFLC